MAPTSTSNLLTRASSKSGLKITNVSVKKGHPTILLASWTYKANSPDYTTIAVIGVSGKDLVVLAGSWFTKGEGPKSGELTVSLDISVLKSLPGEYVLVFLNEDDHDKLYARSKPFHVKKSDF
ncbi:hypothetical protein M407DRAFT_241060 [Tulasnella calospora MUT 4182]|uniref:Uncharacterized protein n=1 Tax=Tulasnella calospora MUT 4182 TaxID=1051891 RepID=A0A0C3LHM4_9AGAM|nr:hypothetical protein M407DRAFT_241060 [Tulasnella calospora MUT 4182]